MYRTFSLTILYENETRSQALFFKKNKGPFTLIPKIATIDIFT